ncbi:MAG TPA: acyl-CoA dehydrogenase family protein [Ktedonobacteraceae bacterium]
MLNFAPTEEQEEICQLAQTLAVDHLRPQGREAERAGDVPADLLRTLAQTGLTTPFSEALGGSGALDAVTYTLIAEELGAGDGAIAMHVLGSLAGCAAVALAGDEQQQRAYLPPFCDPNTGHTHLASLAFAERHGGYTLDEISTTARREGDTWIVNGSKRAVVHGASAHPRVVLARLDGQPGLHGLCALVLANDTPGLSVIPDERKLGLQAVPGATLTFENARVPADNLLGESGHPGVTRAAVLYQLLRAGIACGSARAALEYASDYARERVAFGRPIVSYQGIAFMIAEMAMKLDAARLYLWRAAMSWDRDVELTTLAREAEAAQHQALKIAKAATIDAIQILGGAGFIQDHPVEMWARNAAALD